jgi:ubiquitin-activating enzyme E1
MAQHVSNNTTQQTEEENTTATKSTEQHHARSFSQKEEGLSNNNKRKIVGEEGGDRQEGNQGQQGKKKPRTTTNMPVDTTNVNNGDGNQHEIDEDLHSRQLAVYGRDTMRKMASAHVLVSGLKGLGVEIAKNLVLAGVRAVSLHDEGVVETSDLSSQFYFQPQDVGQGRAQCCSPKLQELNPAVKVSVVESTVSTTEPEFLSQFNVVVCLDCPLEKAKRLDQFCHNHQPPIAFIRADTRGLFAQVFCDFGPNFVCTDTDGETPHVGIVSSISQSNPALVNCVEDERLQFQDGELVMFKEVEGMSELNDGKPRRVKNVKAYSFELEEDTTNFSKYISSGLVSKVKEPKTLNFKPLSECIDEPGTFLLSDYSKMERPALLHVAFLGLDLFQQKKGSLPRPGMAEDAEEFVQMCHEINDQFTQQSKGAMVEKKDLDAKLLRKFAMISRGDLSPMSTLIGGIVAQEALKACSGKFHPTFQFFYFDSIESLGDEPVAFEDVQPSGSRYDGQVVVFGEKFQQKLEKLNAFVVGAGALGCEFLKLLAMMGVSCSKNGKLTVTDDDTIEKSNLSRQFLFRQRDIGRSKSEVAGQAAQGMNPQFNIASLQNRVCPETEDVFNDSFWEGLDVVINALDNVKARLYVDMRCVYFGKPLLESGTLGAKCNTQVVVPGLTENYGASRDPPEKQAPMCTIHSFPHNIDHCLAWARSEFEGHVEKAPAEVNTYLEDTAAYATNAMNQADGQTKEQLEQVADALTTNKLSTFSECIVWARNIFDEYFYNRISQLVYTFPEDAKTSNGSRFWSPPKRFPRAIKFDCKDPIHMMFVKSASILKAQVYQIDIPQWCHDDTKLQEAADAFKTPDFVPKSGVKIETDPKATSKAISSSGDDASVVEDILNVLEPISKDLSPKFRLVPIPFEKDDDTNFHMELITSLANLRARNYSIQEVDKLQAKLIAGRIIPAIATATAAATGLVCLELYKILQNAKIESYRNTFANLAQPLFVSSEPIPPKTFNHKNMKWSLWDRWIIEGDITIQELLDWFVAKDLTSYSISCGPALIYNNLFPKHKERLNKKVLEIVKTVAKLEIPEYRNHFDLVVACEDDEGEDVDIPLVSIKFR